MNELGRVAASRVRAWSRPGRQGQDRGLGWVSLGGPGLACLSAWRLLGSSRLQRDNDDAGAIRRIRLVDPSMGFGRTFDFVAGARFQVTRSPRFQSQLRPSSAFFFFFPFFSPSPSVAEAERPRDSESERESFIQTKLPNPPGDCDCARMSAVLPSLKCRAARQPHAPSPSSESTKRRLPACLRSGLAT